jgi:hypothetical protein
MPDGDWGRDRQGRNVQWTVQSPGTFRVRLTVSEGGDQDTQVVSVNVLSDD